MKIEIDERIKNSYIDNPGYCPFCGSDDMVEIGNKHTEGVVYKRIKCKHCNIEWTEEYALIDIKNATLKD
jgi:transposase-like protein